MNLSAFIASRQPAWARMEQLIRQAGRRGVAALAPSELQELVHLYPSVAVDVSKARLLNADRETQRRVNDLALAAHGMLYHRKSVRVLRAIGTFFARDYPRLFRRNALAMTVSLAVFAAATLASYAVVRADPDLAYVFMPNGLDVPGTGEGVTAGDVSERYRQFAHAPMASGIMANNINVAFTAFALGILLGIGTCYVLLANGMMLGTFFAHFTNHGLTYEVYSYLVPHGALEIFAILVAAAAGIRMGLSLALPGTLTRSASLRTGAKEAVLLVLGTVPMFLVAGGIEGFITPSYWPGGAKIALGLTVWLATMGWLLLVGREPARRA